MLNHNKFFGQLLDISLKSFKILKTFISEFHILKSGFLMKIFNH